MAFISNTVTVKNGWCWTVLLDNSTMVAMVVVAGIRAESSVEALKNKQLYSDAMYGDSAAVADLLARGAKPDGYAYEVSQKM